MSAAATPPDAGLRAAADRYLDGDLDPAEREALRARLLGDPDALQAFVGELRLAMAVGKALDDGAEGRTERAALLMSVLSGSRRMRALRRLEAATVGAAPPAARGRARLAWAALACAATLAAAIAWWGHRGAPPTRGPMPAAPIGIPADAPIARIEPAGSSPAPLDQGAAPAPAAPEPTPETTVPHDPPPATPEVAAAPVAAPPPPQPEAPAQLAGAGTVPARPATPPVIASRLPGGEAPMRPPGAESWLGGYGTVHRRGTATPLRGSSLALAAGDVVETSAEHGCELHLGAGLVVSCSPSTRVVVLPAKSGMPGRRLALTWGGLTAALDDGAPVTIATDHGEVRCDGGGTTVRAYPDWVRVAQEGGHARLVGDGGKKGLEDGQYALLVHGRAVIASSARAASAAMAGRMTMRGDPLLPCVLRLAPPPAPARGAWLHTLAEAGFTTVAVPIGAVDGGLLGDAQAAGLAVIGEMAAEAGAAEGIARGRAHPALLAWWMAAGPSPDAGRIAGEVRRLDPLHILAASFTGEPQRVAPPACDVLVVGQDATPAGMLARWSSPQVAAALRAKAVLAAIPLPAANGDSGPQADRLRCLAYLAMVHGAQGLVWGAGTPVATAPGVLAQPVAIAATVSAELAQLAPSLLHGARQRFQPGDAGLLAARWDGLGRCAVVVVNPSDQALPLSATVPGPKVIAPRLLVEAGAGDVRLSGSHLAGTLPPCGVAIVIGEAPFTP